jgi:hypothetical protein
MKISLWRKFIFRNKWKQQNKIIDQLHLQWRRNNHNVLIDFFCFVKKTFSFIGYLIQDGILFYRLKR